VKRALVDTNILSLFFRGDPNVVARFEEYLSVHDRIDISIVTYYEIVSGLMHRDADKRLAAFLEFAAENTVVLLTEVTVTRSAEVYADLRKVGSALDDVDLLIAGIALANDWRLITNNRTHFDRISGLDVEDWSNPS
jgi:Predicted nucleic acid-binding protein, contains PIN domain